MPGLKAMTSGGGSTATTGPVDSCKTPSPGGPVPVPYPNLAQMSQTNKGTCTKKVSVDGKPPLDITSEISLSSADEAGSAGGGIMSSKIKGPVGMESGSGRVDWAGKKAVYLGGSTSHNGKGNANAKMGKVVAPGQSKVTVQP